MNGSRQKSDTEKKFYFKNSNKQLSVIAVSLTVFVLVRSLIVAFTFFLMQRCHWRCQEFVLRGPENRGVEGKRNGEGVSPSPAN